MSSPYEMLTIYYFEGIPVLTQHLEKHPAFLGVWEDEDVSFLFFSSDQTEMVETLVGRNPDTRLIETYRMTGEQWHGDKIEPYRVNELCVCPPWLSPPKDHTGPVIWMDPGVVFGTGRHQTTEDCLHLVHRLCTRESISTVLDIGTGTGVLSLGAAACGAKRVLACDFNYLAVKTAQRNIGLNRFEERVMAFQARGEEMMAVTSDLLVANIHYDIMRHMIESPYLADNTHIILSGLLNSEAKKVLSALSQKGIHIVERRCPDGVWNTILAKP